MKSLNRILISCTVVSSFISCHAQAPFGMDLLKLEKSIPLPNVKGRIDHMDINLKDRILYIAALGNNTVEVVDIQKVKLIHSIAGLDEPQGIGYIPEHNEIFIANGGNGDCYFYNAANFEKTATIHLSSDADDVRYDPATQHIYVGYGNGGIAVIDANTHTQIGDVKLPTHPEGFQLDKAENILLVNLPGKNMIGVINLKSLKLVDKWMSSAPSANFPFSVDTINHYSFVGYRRPASLVMLNSKTGKVIISANMVSDVDDVYFDYATKKIYISGGGGFINIFQHEKENSLKQVANIPTRSGARTSLLIPQLKLFILAERAESGKPAEIVIYSTQ
jgi:DNA-binding beta-propeller fold protein YncE